MYVHLNVHTNFSLLSGADPVERMLDAAAERGCDALAITDTNGTYGAVRFYKKARERGIRPILGAEIRTAEGSVRVLARNREGFGEICRLVTRRHLQPDFSLLTPGILQFDHVVLMTSDLRLLDHLFELFLVRGIRPREVYVEIPAWSDPDERRRAQRLAAWARHHDFPTVATNQVHFVDPDGHRTHRLLRAVDEICTADSLADDEMAPPHAWLASPAEMEQVFSDYPEAVRNTRAIAEKCHVELPLGNLRFPEFALPPGETAFSYLWQLAFQGARERYRPLSEEVTRRLEKEIGVIGQMGYAPYFLVVWDIVQLARKNGIPTVGRGSAANSIVSYCLGLTHACPIRHDLYFERFLNVERKSPPDIDIDLCWRRRDEVLEYVYDKYGHDKVAMICTYNTFSSRSALRDLAKALGYSEGEIHRIAKVLPHYRGKGEIEKLLKKIPEARDVLAEVEELASVFRIADRVSGYPRHLSIHAGGIVIGDEPLTNLVPLQRSTKGLVITQYDMVGIEDLGLLKIDLLGQRSLSVVADTANVVRQQYDASFDENRLPEREKRTHALMNSGNTIGCFQLESPGMRSLLKKLNMDDLDTLIASLSVIRPGPNDAGMMRHYVDRHNGTEKVEYLHPLLESILHKTYGIMLYQEDILKVASAVAGMTLGEADVLRRAMTKLRAPDNMEQNRKRFVDGALANDVPREVAEELWRQVSGFAGFAFCKAHSVSYALVAYQAAYLKAHYPAEFMAAVLANGGGFYNAHVYIEEARRMGIPILLPDINRSGALFRAENAGERGGIRVGLAQVKELSESTINSILEARRDGPLTSLSEVVLRTGIHYSELRTLIRVGALDSFELTRPEMLWRLEVAFPQLAQGRGNGSTSGRRSLFEAVPKVAAREVIPTIPDYSPGHKLQLEHELLGFTVSAHPLALVRETLARTGPYVKARDLEQHVDGKVRICGWIVTTKSTATKNGETMRFLSVEDDTGLAEATLFPRVYKACGHTLSRPGPHVVEGKVEDDAGSITITADRVEELGRIKVREEEKAVAGVKEW